VRSEVRVLLDPPWRLRRGFGSFGALAQLGEHLLCKQGVVGSIPTGSTTDLTGQRVSALFRPIRTAFDNREERETSEPLVRPSVGVTWGGRMACPTAVLFQVKYTNRMFHGLTRSWGGKMYDFRPGTRAARPRWDEAKGFAKGPFTRGARGAARNACPSLDRIKREKGVWWMPWQQEAMKDVIPCDKLWGAGNRL
jgi:hypothetical protein